MAGKKQAFPRELLFGTAGVPRSSPAPDIVSGIRHIAELGLDALEMEFVRGVRMSDETARQARATASDCGVVLTAHGPYWINLNAQEAGKMKNSHRYIEETAAAGHAAGALSITFHPASLMGDSRIMAQAVTERQMGKVLKKIRKAGITLDVRPELAGKIGQLGSLEEILKLAKNVRGIRPCIDFSHNHARTGAANTYEEFIAILDQMEATLGKTALKTMHAHVSGIEYGERGEKKHLTLKESDFNYKELMRALKTRKCAGIIICESPNLEEDAKLLKNCYRRLKA